MSRMHLISSLFILLALLAGVAGAQEDTPSWCVSVWHPSSDHPDGYETIIRHANIIHEVNPFWYSPLPDGTLLALPEAENPDQLAEWRELDMTIMPSIFTGVPTVITDPDTRLAHIDAIVNTVIAHDYDGIDIDYEDFPAETREDFSVFIEGLAAALHADNRLLSVTVHAKTDDSGTWGGSYAQDWPRNTAVANIFRIMTYDYTSRNESPGPIAPIYWVEDVLEYATSVTALDKVRLGIHFYGYSWQRGTPPATTVNFEGVQRWVESFEAEITRDPAHMEAMIDLRVPGLPRQTVYVADGIGLEFKLLQLTEQFPSLGGIAIWGLGGEDPALWDILLQYNGHCSEPTPPDNAS